MRITGNNQGVANYIPYRESKLTTLLKDSLGGASYCLMIATLSPLEEFIDETR